MNKLENEKFELIDLVGFVLGCIVEAVRLFLIALIVICFGLIYLLSYPFVNTDTRTSSMDQGPRCTWTPGARRDGFGWAYHQMGDCPRCNPKKD